MTSLRDLKSRIQGVEPKIKTFSIQDKELLILETKNIKCMLASRDDIASILKLN